MRYLRFNDRVLVMTEQQNNPIARMYFTREEWFSFPLTLRQRWWKETDYSARHPPQPLIDAIQAAKAAARRTKAGS